MNTLHANRRSLSLARRHATGFTLVELMVAMVLGLIVIAGVTSVFLSGQQSFRTNGALADVQDSSRIAFELMARDIRQAGLTGCNSTNDRIADILNNQSTAWWADWNNVIAGYDNAAVDPAVTSLAAPNAVAGTSSLELIGAGVDPSQTTAMYDGTTPAFTLALPAPELTPGDAVRVCTPGHAALFQTSGYTQSSGTVDFGGTASPGNSTTDLSYPPGSGRCTAAQSGTYPPAIYCFPPNSLLSELQAVDWYVGTNKENGTSLYRISLQNLGGVPTPVSQEMVRGVTKMTISYLDPALNNSFETAAQITAGSGWPGVTAVNVALTVDSTFQRASVNGQAPIQRTYSFTTTLRNRVN